MTANVDCSGFDIPPIFDLIAHHGQIDKREMYNVFNMGVGMVVSVPSEYADETVRLLCNYGINAGWIGELVQGDGGIILG